MHASTIQWGLLGPGHLPTPRRLRTLGLGAAVRHFNDRAVPGLGGVWFGKQVVLSLLGVYLAERCGRGKLEVANAIEALGCWLAIHKLKAGQDPRLRGHRKLANVTAADLRYRNVRRAGFYVSQPMRMATVQALPALGLVENGSTRFSAYVCTRAGTELVEAFAEAYRPWNSSLEAVLAGWIQGDETIRAGDTLCRALAPNIPLPAEAIGQLHERLLRGGDAESQEDTARRRDLLAWAEARRIGAVDDLDWGRRPQAISSSSHWHDLEAGGRFLLARDAALNLLTLLEVLMPADGLLRVDTLLCSQASAALDSVRSTARAFLELGHPEALATAFCRECLAPGNAEVLRTLVARDGLVLRLRGDDIVRGHAFAAGAAAAPTEPPETDGAVSAPGPLWPPGISHRVVNLYRLNQDLHGELEQSLAAVVAEEGAE